MKLRWGPALLPRLRREIVGDARGIVSRMDALGDRAAHAGLDATSIRETAWTIWDRFAAAEMIWVAAEMAAAALDASHDIPYVDPGSAPWPTGLLVFATPLPPLPVARPLTLHDGTEWTGSAPVCALSWHHDAQRLYVTRYCRRATLRVQDGELQAVAALKFARHRTVDLAATTEAVAQEEGHPADDVRLLALLAATWTMMLTPTVARRRTLDPATGQIAPADAAPVPDPDRVTLIDLRPMRHVDTDREPGPSGRVYRHRWIVRGHWREQPHGPARQLRRTTWIPSYVKGPAGAPLLATDKVLVWRR